MKTLPLTQGNILKSLLTFAVPVLLALFLQAMYGAADLLIVGRFAGTAEQSGVATGSQLFNLITMVVAGLSMGVTVFVGNAAGAGDAERAGKGIGGADRAVSDRVSVLPAARRRGAAALIGC